MGNPTTWKFRVKFRVNWKQQKNVNADFNQLKNYSKWHILKFQKFINTKLHKAGLYLAPIRKQDYLVQC